MPTIAPQPQRHKLKIRLHPQQARFCYSKAFYRACQIGSIPFIDGIARPV
jgi:hypothetical protein